MSSKQNLALLLAAVALSVSAGICQNRVQVTRSPYSLPRGNVYAKKAIQYQRITADEFHKYHRTVQDLKNDSVVVLKSGAAVYFKDFLDEVNVLEQQLNPYGYTLRDALQANARIAGPVMLGETVSTFTHPTWDTKRASDSLSMDITRTPDLNGKLKQFTPVKQELVTVLDPSIIGLKVNRSSSVDHATGAFNVKNELTVDAYAFGRKGTVLSLSTSSSLPVGLVAKQNLARKTEVRYARLWEESSEKGIPNGAEVKAYLDIPKNPAGLELYDGPVPGCPIPLTIRIGFSEYEMGSLSAAANVDKASDQILFEGAVSAYVDALADAAIVAAGLEFEADILGIKHYFSRNQLTLAKQPDANSWSWSSANWTSDREFKMETGAGRIRLIIEVDLLFTSIKYGWDLINWEGKTFIEPATSTSQAMVRPAGCGGEYLENAQCTASDGQTRCADLSSSPSDCGGCNVAVEVGHVCRNGQDAPIDSSRPRECAANFECCSIDPRGFCTRCERNRALCDVKLPSVIPISDN